MRLLKCDRCGLSVKATGRLMTAGSWTIGGFSDWDLCGECLRKFKQFMVAGDGGIREDPNKIHGGHLPRNRPSRERKNDEYVI